MQLRWQETTRGSPASDGFRELILPLVQTCGVCRGTQTGLKPPKKKAQFSVTGQILVESAQAPTTWVPVDLEQVMEIIRLIW